MVTVEQLRREAVRPAPVAMSWAFWLNPRPEATGIFVARAALGIVMLAHGLQKLGLWGGHGWSGTLEWFQNGLGIPPWLGAVAILTEVVGGAFLLIGLLSRAAALFVAAEMAVAVIRVHLPNGFFLNWSNTPGVGHGFEMNLMLIAVATMVLLEGPGRFALDTEIGKALVKQERIGNEPPPL